MNIYIDSAFIGAFLGAFGGFALGLVIGWIMIKALISDTLGKAAALMQNMPLFKPTPPDFLTKPKIGDNKEVR